jgi:hypothetical protein
VTDVGQEWALAEAEVSQLGYLHGEMRSVAGRKPHERCSACGQAYPCVSLRLVRHWMDSRG